MNTSSSRRSTPAADAVSTGGSAASPLIKRNSSAGSATVNTNFDSAALTSFDQRPQRDTQVADQHQREERRRDLELLREGGHGLERSRCRAW